MPDTELPRSQQTTNETGQTYETACFQTLDNSLPRTVIAEKRETRLVSCTVTLAFYLKTTPRAQCGDGEPRAQDPAQLRRRTWQLKATRAQDMARGICQAGRRRKGAMQRRSPVNRRIGSPRLCGHIPTAQPSGEGPWGHAESNGWWLADNRQLPQLTLGTTSTRSNHLRVEKPQ